MSPLLLAVVTAGAAETATAPEAAEPKEKKVQPSIKVSGLLYPRWSLDLTEGADLFNAFDIDRSYLRADAKLDDRWGVRITLDANRESPPTVTLPDGTEVEGTADTRLRVYLKHAWVQYQPTPDLVVRGGLCDTAFLPFEEAFEGMRYLFKVFLDDNGLESTTDFGVSASGSHADGAFGWGLGVYNGEFYTSPEVDPGKSFQGRVTVDPLVRGTDLALPITLFVDEELVTGDDAKTTFGGFVGFRAPVLLATAQVDGVTQGSRLGLGQSVLLRGDVPDVLFVFGRADHFDPDSTAGDDGDVKLWGGVGRDFLKTVSLAATYRRTMFEATPDLPEQVVAVQAQAGF